MKRKKPSSENFLGSGLLLNPEFLEEILQTKPKVDWFEIVSEDLMGSQQNNYQIRVPKNIEKLLALYPVTLHGVEMSIGSIDPFDMNYLKQLRELKKVIQPTWVSDHLCWTGARNLKAHELLPLPYTNECLDHLCERIDFVQNFFKEPLVFENPPNYITYEHTEMTEWEFIAEVSRKSGCGLLLDLNNLYVSSSNNHYNPNDFLNHFSNSHVKQIHLAGHDEESGFVLDTHAQLISEEVWSLYRKCTELLGPITTNVEWDLNVPSMGVLIEQAAEAKKIQKKTSVAA